GTGFKAQLDGAPKPANFETGAAITAYPQLSQFHLYRPRQTPLIVHGTDTFYVEAADPSAVKLKAGDRIMVGIPRSGGTSLDHSQVLTVDKVWQAFGITFVKMKGGITSLAASLTYFTPAFGVDEVAFSGSFGLVQAFTPTSMAIESSASSLSSNMTLRSFTGSSKFTEFAAPIDTSFTYYSPLYEQVLAAGVAVATVRSVGEMRAYKLGGSFR